MAINDTTLIYLKDWLDQSILWLRADGSPEVLQKPHAQLLEMMYNAKRENRPNEVWNLMDRLDKLANRAGDTLQQGEIFLKCAKMAADLENFKDALGLFQAANNKYLGYLHQHAVVQWMMGCIHWVMLENVEAISEWQTAISSFRDQRSNLQIDSVKVKWYDERLLQLEEALATAIAAGELPPGNLIIPQTGAPTSPEQTSSTKDTFDGDSLRWMSCQVSESVPAGGFGPTGFDPHPLGFLEISEVLIEDEPYKVFSAHRASSKRNIVDISSQSQYRTICVIGTSMNAAKPTPINDGDFVLIQAQPVVNDNEIVVAEIYGQNGRSTIKRLKRQNGKIRLVPETTDPKNIEIDWEMEFDELDDGFRIIGVVEAVFKRKPV